MMSDCDPTFSPMLDTWRPHASRMCACWRLIPWQHSMPLPMSTPPARVQKATMQSPRLWMPWQWEEEKTHHGSGSNGCHDERARSDERGRSRYRHQREGRRWRSSPRSRTRASPRRTSPRTASRGELRLQPHLRRRGGIPAAGPPEARGTPVQDLHMRRAGATRATAKTIARRRHRRRTLPTRRDTWSWPSSTRTTTERDDFDNGENRLSAADAAIPWYAEGEWLP